MLFRIRWSVAILLMYLAQAMAQCPWSGDATALQSACKCNNRKEGRLELLEIECNSVNFGQFVNALKKSTTTDSKPISRIHVTNSTVGILPDSIFNGTKVIGLKLSKCKIRIIGDKAFEGIGSTLRILDLQQNLLSKVPGKALKMLPLLRSLDLSRNEIVSIEDGAFQNSPSLENIEVADNELLISDSAFSGLEYRLKMLNLKSTGQTEIPKAVLKITSLKQLDLAQNKIRRIEPNQMSTLKSLEWLNLERNRILELEKEAFKGINSLRTLSLLNNILLNFPTEALANLENLRTLDIGFNGIKELPNDAFKAVKHLSLIAIEGNPLTTIPEEAFQHLKENLLGFSFGGQFLDCNCQVKWISEWIKEIGMQVTSRERNPQFCGFPEELQSKNFNLIKPEEFICKEPLTTTTEEVTTTTTTTTTISSTPKSTLTTLPTSISDVEKFTEKDMIIFNETDKRPSTPIVRYSSTTFKSARPPLIPPPPPPILKVGDIPPRPRRPNIKNNDKYQGGIIKNPEVQKIKVTRADRVRNSIVVEWETSTNNILGYQVMYRTFGAKDFKKSQQLSAQTRNHLINDLPEDECCYIVCVVKTEDAILPAEKVPPQQCMEMERDEQGESSSNMDKIIIGISAAICLLIIIAVIIFCICSCSKKKTKQQQYMGHPQLDPIKIEPDWDRASMYSGRSIPRARLYHDTKSNGSINNDYMHDDGRSYSLSHIPNGYHDNYSRSMMPDAQSHRSASRASYIPHVHQPSLGRQSAHSMSQLSARHSHMGMTSPVDQRRKKLDRVGRVGGISAASSLHSLTSYEQDPAIRNENWNDHDMEIYVGRNHIAQPSSKKKSNYR